MPGHTSLRHAFVIGIDPGWSGGIAMIPVHRGTGRGSPFVPHGPVTVADMPHRLTDTWDLISSLPNPESCFAVIEKVGGYTGGGEGRKGGGAANGSAMFKFGQSYGILCMALTAAGIPSEAVVPRTWQKFLGILPRRKGGKNRKGTAPAIDLKKAGKSHLPPHDHPADRPELAGLTFFSGNLAGEETKGQWKARLREFAQKIHPGVKITLRTSDALLIAEYALRSRSNPV